MSYTTAWIPRPTKPLTTEIAEVLADIVRQVTRAFKVARKPGMPLGVLGNVAREAPLGSLLIAFLLGVAIGRRRSIDFNVRAIGS
jgi:hypothetical protein